MKTISFETYLLMQASLMSAQTSKGNTPTVSAACARIDADAIIRLNKAEVETFEREILNPTEEKQNLYKKVFDKPKCEHKKVNRYRSASNPRVLIVDCAECGESLPNEFLE